jgi:hypothetical protein
LVGLVEDHAVAVSHLAATPYRAKIKHHVRGRNFARTSQQQSILPSNLTVGHQQNDPVTPLTWCVPLHGHAADTYRLAETFV